MSSRRFRACPYSGIHGAYLQIEAAIRGIDPHGSERREVGAEHAVKPQEIRDVLRSHVGAIDAEQFATTMPVLAIVVHRSVIVNLSRVRGLRTDDYRDFEILLDDGRAVRLSRTYRETFERALGSRL